MFERGGVGRSGGEGEEVEHGEVERAEREKPLSWASWGRMEWRCIYLFATFSYDQIISLISTSLTWMTNLLPLSLK
jgi:hypothetical protein